MYRLQTSPLTLLENTGVHDRVRESLIFPWRGHNSLDAIDVLVRRRIFGMSHGLTNTALLLFTADGEGDISDAVD